MIADAKFGPGRRNELPHHRLAGRSSEYDQSARTSLALRLFSSALSASAANFNKLGFHVQQSASRGSEKKSVTNQVLPGSMISVGLVTGDMTMTADGTVTYVDGSRCTRLATVFSIPAA